MSAEDLIRRAIEAQGKYDPDDIIEAAREISDTYHLPDRPEPVRDPPRGDKILGERDDEYPF